jgi:hypothetical protein
MIKNIIMGDWVGGVFARRRAAVAAHGARSAWPEARDAHSSKKPQLWKAIDEVAKYPSH